VELQRGRGAEGQKRRDEEEQRGKRVERWSCRGEEGHLGIGAEGQRGYEVPFLLSLFVVCLERRNLRKIIVSTNYYSSKVIQRSYHRYCMRCSNSVNAKCRTSTHWAILADRFKNMEEAIAADIFGMFANAELLHLFHRQTSISSDKDSQTYHAFIVCSTIVMNNNTVIITRRGRNTISIFLGHSSFMFSQTLASCQ